MSRYVVVKTFWDPCLAEVAKGILEAHDIFSIIMGDDSGGARPYVNIGSPINLSVFEKDLEVAQALLDESHELPPEP